MVGFLTSRRRFPLLPCRNVASAGVSGLFSDKQRMLSIRIDSGARTLVDL